MKAYVYSAAELGLSNFSDGILRLNCETTDNPDDADIFVVPEALFKFTDRHAIEQMKHYYKVLTAGPIWLRREAPHVFLDLSEHFTTYTVNDPIFIRAALTKSALEAYPNSIPWPWPAKDYSECINPPESGFMYDVTFHGWLSCLVRKVSAKCCLHSKLITSSIREYTNFFGYQTPAEQTRRDRLYRDAMRRSRMCLTQESIPGVIPYRFYEAMSAGRCQLYIGRNYNLPFADEIPYHNFVNFLDIDQADDADQFVHSWVTRYPDPVLISKGREARHYWQKYLQPANWIETMTYAVEKKVGQLCESRS